MLIFKQNAIGVLLQIVTPDAIELAALVQVLQPAIPQQAGAPGARVHSAELTLLPLAIIPALVKQKLHFVQFPLAPLVVIQIFGQTGVVALQSV